MKGQYRRKKSYGGSIASGAASGAATGASIGSAIPVVGTAIGAIGGAIIGGTVGYFKERKRKKEEEKLNKAKQKVLNQYEASLEQNDYLTDQMYLETYNNMYNEKALGGELPSGTMENIHSFLQAAQKNGGSQMLNSSMAKFKGAAHEQNGIEMDANLDGIPETEVEGDEVIQDTRIYSKRLKITDNFIDTAKKEGFSFKKGSYAEIAEKLGRKKEKYELKLQEQVDEAAINTGEIMLERVNNLLNILFLDQETSK